MKRIDVQKLNSVLTITAEKDLAEAKIGGAELIVNQCGKRIFHKCFGNFCTGGAPLAGGEIYRIASMTKPITGVAMAQLAEQGVFDLEEPVSKYLPSYGKLFVGHLDEHNEPVAERPASTELKLFHLATHTSGLGSGSMSGPVYVLQPRDTLNHAVDYYPTVPLSYDPFTKQEYSSPGFDVAARIIELVTGMRYGAYLKKYIFDPLGMVDTFFMPTEEQWKRLVAVHMRTDDGKCADDETTPGCVHDFFLPTYERAGGGLASTAEDYSAFMEMLLNRGVGKNGARILGEAGYELLTRPWVPESIMPGTQRWGLGVRVVTADVDRLGQTRGVFGWSGAYGTHFWVDPENRLTALYMRNSNWDSSGCGTIGERFETDVVSCFTEER